MPRQDIPFPRKRRELIMDRVFLGAAIVLALVTPAVAFDPGTAFREDIRKTMDGLSSPLTANPGQLAMLSPRPHEVLDLRRLESSLANLKPDLLTTLRGARESQIYAAASP